MSTAAQTRARREKYRKLGLCECGREPIAKGHKLGERCLARHRQNWLESGKLKLYERQAKA